MQKKKVALLFWSLVIGVLSGVTVIAYRLILSGAEKLSFWTYHFLKEHMLWFPLWMGVLIVIGFLVGKMIQKNGMISGSGIPQLKGILSGHLKDSWLGTLCAKFAGGAMAILGGLSLGREGPSVQLGACVAQGISKKISLSDEDRSRLIAGGASAGLSAAFNAPLAGVVFALEELFDSFSPLLILSTMAASAAADFISKAVFGLQPVFQFPESSMLPLASYWLLLVLGAVLGICGMLYNKILLGIQKLYQKWIPVDKRPLIPFVLAGLLGILLPAVLCGGHEMLSYLHLSTGLWFLLLLLAVKFLFSMISFGSGTPGGIFFPLLIIGATIGTLFGNISVHFLGCAPDLFYLFVILAMAGYFTAIVRAPITGIILICEMTGSFQHLLPLTVVSFVAYAVTELLKSKPIYESLLENLLRRTASEQ